MCLLGWGCTAVLFSGNLCSPTSRSKGLHSPSLIWVLFFSCVVETLCASWGTPRHCLRVQVRTLTGRGRRRKWEMNSAEPAWAESGVCLFSLPERGLSAAASVPAKGLQFWGLMLWRKWRDVNLASLLVFFLWNYCLFFWAYCVIGYHLAKMDFLGISIRVGAASV